MQGILEELNTAGYALYAVSYDSLEVLSRFAANHGITYPLLSDEGSSAIRSLGLLNEEAAEAVFGIPHPGTFVLNADGTVRSKHFYPSYRERDTGAGVLEHLLGIAAPTRGGVKVAVGEGVEVRAQFDNDTYAWGQRLWLTVEVEIAPGLHVYGRPIPEGYYPLEVEIEPIERVNPGAPTTPPTLPFRIAGLDEGFNVYQGTVKVQLPITFLLVDAGPLDVAVNVSFQACTDSECLMPESVRIVLPLREASLIERQPPART